jgi:two-component system, NtrC family, sensor kinase
MKRKIFYTLSIFFVMVTTGKAQRNAIDSLSRIIRTEINDTMRMVLYGRLSNYYSEFDADSGFAYSQKMLGLARRMNFKVEEATALGEMGYAMINMANYSRSLQYILEGIRIAEDPRSEKNIVPAHYPTTDEVSDRKGSARNQRLQKLARIEQYAGILYNNTNNTEKSLYYQRRAAKYATESETPALLSIIYLGMGRTYLQARLIDSALLVEQRSLEMARESGFMRYLGSIYLNIGRAYMAQGKKETAFEYIKKGLEASREFGYYRGVVASDLAIAEYYKQQDRQDSSFLYLKEALQMANYLMVPDLQVRAYSALADYYKKKGNNDSTVRYQSMIIKINDSLFGAKQSQQFQNIDFDEQQRQQQRETDRAAYRTKVRFYALLAGLAVFFFIALLFWRNARIRKKANTQLSVQKTELESTLSTLKATQAQLIHSEKMASLGELTAGIAHEIQNPLNFINNFSELNAELIADMNEALEKNQAEEAGKIGKTIAENESKILFHGKRADGIVKGMLQHSRSSSGQKELVNINTLADEYLRLAYHGLRAKEKSFSASYNTELDERIPPLPMVPQEMGRVLLNLVNNAFYAVNKRKEKENSSYQPTVTIRSKLLDGYAELRIKDNGLGIPARLLDKIFQPFFTTKPTGEGTGLGLSLSYDIIKSHNGELRVETEQGKGTEFIVLLPLS